MTVPATRLRSTKPCSISVMRARPFGDRPSASGDAVETTARRLPASVPPTRRFAGAAAAGAAAGAAAPRGLGRRLRPARKTPATSAQATTDRGPRWRMRHCTPATPRGDGPRPRVQRGRQRHAVSPPLLRRAGRVGQRHEHEEIVPAVALQRVGRAARDQTEGADDSGTSAIGSTRVPRRQRRRAARRRRN